MFQPQNFKNFKGKALSSLGRWGPPLTSIDGHRHRGLTLAEDLSRPRSPTSPLPGDVAGDKDLNARERAQPPTPLPLAAFSRGTRIGHIAGAQ